jgi:hypothetical protein
MYKGDENWQSLFGDMFTADEKKVFMFWLSVHAFQCSWSITSSFHYLLNSSFTNHPVTM